MKVQIVPLSIQRYDNGIAEKYAGSLLSSGGGWYLHGQLAEDNHYDIGLAVLNLENSKFLPYGRRDLYINGEVDAEVLGYSKPCKGFFYTIEDGDSWIQRGLVCYADDEKACNQARSKMKAKSSWL